MNRRESSVAIDEHRYRAPSGNIRGNDPPTFDFKLNDNRLMSRGVFDSTALPIATGTIEWRRGVARLNATAHSDSPPHSHSSLSNGRNGLWPLVKRS